MSRHYAAFPITAVKSLDGEAGTFEAVVSVFNNVDLTGDRILEGAFAGTLDRLRKTGDPVPVIWSHQWHDLDAYIGEANPDEIRELAPGDPELPEVIRDHGGLMVKAQVDLEDPTARKALKLLKSRAVREFSFAYDVLKEAPNEEDGINELHELELLEIGPTLKGANPLTQLVGAKAEAIARQFKDVDTEELAKAIELELTAGAEEEEEPAAGEELDDAKALSALAGILDRVDVALKGVGLEVIVTKAGARNSGADLGRIQGIHDLTSELGANCVDPDGSSSADEDTAKFINPGVLAATLDLELTELE